MILLFVLTFKKFIIKSIIIIKTIMQAQSPHQKVLMRDCLGIDAEVTEDQLETIKTDQIQKGEVYLLHEIIPMQEQRQSFAHLQDACRLIMILGNCTNLIYQTKGIIWARSNNERNVNLMYTLNSMFVTYFVYRSYNKKS